MKYQIVINIEDEDCEKGQCHTSMDFKNPCGKACDLDQGIMKAGCSHLMHHIALTSRNGYEKTLEELMSLVTKIKNFKLKK